ncbi:peptidoglycan recognition protein family protein [Blastococcus sp. SYSU DS0617]
MRFLIVHHSASPNGYASEGVPRVLRGFHAFHTGPEKGWPDVAYNFFVDRFGVVWEGRAGSLDGPVLPDATGGSQGFSQIACFIGDHSTEAPTPEAQRSMTLLLAALAGRYGIDPRPGATAGFVSRGSNKWPAGAPVTAATISGHRDMSLTSCPGDAAYPLVRDIFPAEVVAVLAARAAAPAPAEAPPASPPAEPQGAAPTAIAPTATSPAVEASSAEDDGGLDPTTVALAGAGAMAAVVTTVTILQLRGRNDEGPAGVGDRPPGAQL